MRLMTANAIAASINTRRAPKTEPSHMASGAIEHLRTGLNGGDPGAFVEACMNGAANVREPEGGEAWLTVEMKVPRKTAVNPSHGTAIGTTAPGAGEVGPARRSGNTRRGVHRCPSASGIHSRDHRKTRP